MRHRSWLRNAAVATCAAAFALAAGPAAAGAAENYVVLYKQQSTAGGAANDVKQAGGSLVANYSQIGVVIASSGNAGFAARMRIATGVEQVASTKRFGSKPFEDAAAVDEGASGPKPGGLPNAPATDADSLSPLQWDMRQIKSPEAHAITGGSPSVVVGDIDTGLDFTHPTSRRTTTPHARRIARAARRHRCGRVTT